MSNKNDKIEFDLKYSFSDVLLIPRKSRVSQKDVDLRSKINNDIILNTPIISSPKSTITNDKMAIGMAINGGLGIIHNEQSLEKQIINIKNVKNFKLKGKELENEVDSSVIKNKLLVGAEVSAEENILYYSQKLITAGADILCIDFGHANSLKIIEAVKKFTSYYPEYPLIVGNVATIDGAKALIEIGVKLIKVGLGTGTTSVTRRATGVGYPQFSSVYEISKYVKKRYPDVKIIADGGMISSGDITKALAAGADFVILGSMFAGIEEAASKISVINGKKYKKFGEIYKYLGIFEKSVFYEVEKKSSKNGIPKIERYAELKGSLKENLEIITSGIKLGFSYLGCLNISELHEHARFIFVNDNSHY